MGRYVNEWGHIRTVKPSLFDHEELYEAEIRSGLPLRLAFVGLFCQADRRGRFKWRPRRLKNRVLPYDELELEDVLAALVENGFLVRYEAAGETFGAFPTWESHQSINGREAESELPAPPGLEIPERLVPEILTRQPGEDDASSTRDNGRPESAATRRDAGRGERKGKERNGKERKGKVDQGDPKIFQGERTGPTFVALSHKLQPKELGDRKLVADIAELVDAGSISERDAYDAAEGSIVTDGVRNRFAYFLTVLRENVGEEQLDKLLAGRRGK